MIRNEDMHQKDSASNNVLNGPDLKISLVIPAYNEEKYIWACLEQAIMNTGMHGQSITKLGSPKERSGKIHEIIVIDNASTDGTSNVVNKIASKYPDLDIRIVREDKKGLTKARQRGLVEARGDLIAYVDADTRIGPKWLDTVMKAFHTDPNLVCLSGPYKYYDGSRAIRVSQTIFWWLTAPISYRIAGYMVLGGNFVAKKSALIAMGGFDTSIDFYGEDTDIARRISHFGRSVFRMDFYIHSSSRRQQSEGFIKTNITYGLNFIWPILFHRPFTKRSKDIRL